MDFSSEEEVRKALKCNREYMGRMPAWWQVFFQSVTP